ncbi:hypothetical protein [Roseovarius sp.]|jgi:hypothetical protein|uniref:hypothetical protein n=1 Tax=Roseovarius sp. TaxID=1486281 RepID=UPI0032ED5A83
MNIDERTQVSRKAGNGEGVPEAQAMPGTDHRESADGYRGVILTLGQYRVAVCRDGLQWLFQRRRPGFAGVGPAWDTLGFCTSRNALIRLHRSHIGAETPVLLQLPELFKREGAE